jgi:hypothetical protein
MSILPKAIYRFKAILFKIPMAFLMEVGENKPKIHREAQKISNSLPLHTCTHTKRPDESLVDFKIYYTKP